MNLIEPIALAMLGLALVAGVAALVYVLLPSSVLQAAAHHGRYAGVGAGSKLND